jgi:peroxiredoxin
MVEVGQKAPEHGFNRGSDGSCLLVFLEADCPTCRLSMPYLNKLGGQSMPVIGISQDTAPITRQFAEQTGACFPAHVDNGLRLSRAFDPVAVPAFFLINAEGSVVKAHIGFDKDELNALASHLGLGPVADAYDGRPQRKPGCSSRHFEPLWVRGDMITSCTL